jgi:hypothetical protein
MRVSLTEKREFWGDQVYVSYSHILTSLSVNFGVFHHFVILVLHISRASCAGVQNNGWLLLQGEASSGHGVDLCRRSSGEQRWRLLLLPQEGR